MKCFICWIFIFAPCFLLAQENTDEIEIIVEETETPSPERSSDDQEASKTSPALKALQSSELSKELKALPDANSPNLRLIQDTDEVQILRSEGNWFEVDVISNSGLEFRGWVYGELPTELESKPREVSITQDAIEEGPSPLTSSRFLWFWDSGWEERGHFGFDVGLQSISLKLKGTNPDDDRVGIPGYAFTGFQGGLQTSFGIFETQIKKIPYRLEVDGSYHIGFFQVRFANNFEPREVAGDAYRIQTHKVLIRAWNEFKFQWKEISVRPALAAGYFFFESAPELKRTTAGNVVFTQLGISSALLSLKTEFSWRERVFISPSFNYLVLPSVQEAPDSFSGAGEKTSLALKGMPLFLEFDAEYRWTESLGTELKLAYLQFDAKHSGPSRRIDVSYDDVDLKFKSMSAFLGLKFYY